VNGRFLLDTNIIIALFSEDPKIHEHITDASEVFIPCIAIGELYFGAYTSTRVKENHARIDEFALNNTVLLCDTETAKRYGEVKNRLKEKANLYLKMTYGLLPLLSNMTLRLLPEMCILRAWKI